MIIIFLTGKDIREDWGNIYYVYYGGLVPGTGDIALTGWIKLIFIINERQEIIQAHCGVMSVIFYLNRNKTSWIIESY